MPYSIRLDHFILNVNDVDETLSFWCDVLGCKNEGYVEPFTILRITDDLVFNLAPWGTDGGSHFAFALSAPEFKKVFQHLKDNNIPYGDSFHEVGNLKGPGVEPGAKGMGKSIYFFDPNKHLLEIRTYDPIE